MELTAKDKYSPRNMSCEEYMNARERRDKLKEAYKKNPYKFATNGYTEAE